MACGGVSVVLASCEPFSVGTVLCTLTNQPSTPNNHAKRPMSLESYQYGLVRASGSEGNSAIWVRTFFSFPHNVEPLAKAPFELVGLNV